MQFNDIPRSFFKQVFQALNMIALVAWVLLVTDMIVPGKHFLEQVTGFEYRYVRHTSPSGASWPVTYLVYTTSKVVDGTDLVVDSLVHVGDTVKMKTTPFFDKVYEMGVRKEAEVCCIYEMYPIRRAYHRSTLVLAVLGVVLQLLTITPRVSTVNRVSAAFFAYIFLVMCAVVYLVPSH